MWLKFCKAVSYGRITTRKIFAFEWIFFKGTSSIPNKLTYVICCYYHTVYHVYLKIWLLCYNDNDNTTLTKSYFLFLFLCQMIVLTLIIWHMQCMRYVRRPHRISRSWWRSLAPSGHNRPSYQRCCRWPETRTTYTEWLASSVSVYVNFLSLTHSSLAISRHVSVDVKFIFLTRFPYEHVSGLFFLSIL